MTILPKKKSSAAGVAGERADDAETHGHPHGHALNNRTGARPRASPPPWGSYQSPEERRNAAEAHQHGAGTTASVAATHGAPCEALGELACCSGPGLSKRRRQAAVYGGAVNDGGAGALGPDTEEGAGGNNSEDEYENATRPQAVDPATAEQQEQWFEKMLKEKKGFVIKKMKEDGACLFRAVADQVYGDQDMHDVVRKHCMDYLVKNADYFSSYVTEDFTTYINRKRKSNCHGNHIEMQAMAEMYNRPVEVYQHSIDPINTFHSIHQNNDEPIRVSYHRNIHYNSVVNPNKATIGVGLGLPSFKPGHAEQSLMKHAIKTSEESWIEQQMLEDKKKATDWEATNEAIEEQVARESYLQWLQDQEKARQPRKATATCSSATAATSSCLDDWSRSPRQQSAASSPEHHGPTTNENRTKSPSPEGATRILSKPPSPCAPGPSSQAGIVQDCSSTSSLVSLYPSLGYQAIMQEISPGAFGLTDWEDGDILASVLAVSQQEYLDSMKKKTMHRESSPDSS
ncbi:OTU domain-containing protein 5b [Hoplias malabaricus]|uniref:OTU domain-containing protein 5b n=1 Tax=Hoplias malabaricus TaxID=27720 RepID=UPI0034623342